VRARRLTAIVAGVLALGGGAAIPALARSGGPSPRPPRAGLSSAGVTATLAHLLSDGSIAEGSYRRYSSAYAAAERSLSRLGGTRAEELGAVLANLQAINAAGELTPSRLPALFLTLERNRQWWTSERLLSSGDRVSFPGSRLVWEYYPGQGIEIQWLATFGEANGYFLSGYQNEALRQVLGEAIPLAARRAGGIAWEYLFQFDGGQPPWTSGLSQGTGVQVLARAYSRLKVPAYLTAAQQALGVFQHPPPAGVRVATRAGARYAEYTYNPGDRILNGFIQSLVGLYDYAALTKDPLGLRLFEQGDAQARLEVPQFDTGAWSLYDQYEESNLNYHELLTEFLHHLCERTSKGPPFTTALASPPASSGPPAGGTSPGAGTGAAGSTGATGSTGAAGSTGAGSTGAGTSGAGGGVGAGAASATRSTAGIPGDQIYCTTAKRFSADLTTPPAIALLSKNLPAGARVGVQVSLSKISTVSITVRQGSRVVWTNSATVTAGTPRLLWVTPAGGGTFTVSVSATDLAGNHSSTSGTIVVH